MTNGEFAIAMVSTPEIIGRKASDRSQNCGTDFGF